MGKGKGILPNLGQKKGGKQAGGVLPLNVRIKERKAPPRMEGLKLEGFSGLTRGKTPLNLRRERGKENGATWKDKKVP